MKKILQRDEPVLRKVTEHIPLTQIKSEKIQNILNEMKEALDSQDDGVAIAAPQIGYPLRIFIVSKKVEAIMREEKIGKIANDSAVYDDKDLIFINPVIKKISKERKMVEEGCLSVRYLYGKVSRATKVRIEAYDEHGKKFERGGTGLLAQIFQHETDHLDGVLFFDKATDLEEIPPASVKQTKIDEKI